MKNHELSLDEALGQECEHGVPKVIICPTCEPEAYRFTDKELKKILASIDPQFLQEPAK